MRVTISNELPEWRFPTDDEVGILASRPEGKAAYDAILEYIAKLACMNLKLVRENEAERKPGEHLTDAPADIVDGLMREMFPGYMMLEKSNSLPIVMAYKAIMLLTYAARLTQANQAQLQRQDAAEQEERENLFRKLGMPYDPTVPIEDILNDGNVVKVEVEKPHPTYYGSVPKHDFFRVRIREEEKKDDPMFDYDVYTPKGRMKRSEAVRLGMVEDTH